MVGMYRSDGPPATMVAAAEAIAVGARVQREKLRKLYEKYGELSDWDVVCVWPDEYSGAEILEGSVHARRAELILDGVVDDTGSTTISGRSKQRVALWDLVLRISPEQIKKNILLRQKRRKNAWNFAMTLANDPSEMADFMRMWTEKKWSALNERWPQFGRTPGEIDDDDFLK